MPPYMRRLWQSGCCPFLVPASFYEDRAGYRYLINAEGLIRVRTYAAVCPDGIEESFCMLLHMLASAADSFLQLQSWLADPAHISLHPEDLYYDAKGDRCLLSFFDEADAGPFSERFAKMCSGLGGSGDLIASRLFEACRRQIMDEKGIRAFLRNWRQEILDGC